MCVCVWARTHTSLRYENIIKNEQRETPLSMGEKIRFAMDAARGMQFLHEHHIMHRDLKSMNLLVTNFLIRKKKGHTTIDLKSDQNQRMRFGFN
jgi:serine/threonine protein kinase